MSRIKTRVSVPIIFMLVALMATFIYVQLNLFGIFDADEIESVQLSDEKWGKLENIKAAAGMYHTLKQETNAPNFTDRFVPQRTLSYFYSLRAYDGAPPVISHRIDGDKSLTGGTCLGCHEKGGYTPKFNAYAPVVPHPEKQNCRQCHNPREARSLFRGNWWRKKNAQRGLAHLPGGPLVIPHGLQMRENCLACHSGPGAVREIRTSHPERVNCLQCHVVQNTEKEWSRP